MIADYSLEQELISKGYTKIVGVDEAGRGCGLGPVVAAAVYVPEESIPVLAGSVKDSKKLTAKKRELLYDKIIECCEYGIAEIDNKVIDKINILQATKVAMKKAIHQIKAVEYALVDGNMVLDNVNYKQNSVIKGDAISISIAAASILAKVYRDSLVVNGIHQLYPQYGIDKHKGYLTKAHCEALKKYGPCPYHRVSFKGVT